jgi:signal transduction histidine kinase
MAESLHGMLDDQRALLLAMSHELRSPLTRARVNTELLDDSPERTALLRDLGEMRELINSLLESERLARGADALQAEPVDLAALARDVVSTQFEGQTFTLQLDAAIGPVRADPARLRLLLRNLIDNALRHGAGATQPPEVFLRREPDGRIALGVRDHGPGVPVEHLARLGQAFYRPDSSRTRGSGGVGLGLYLCQRVAQAHGGELRLRAAEPGLEVSAVWAPRAAPASGAAAARS